MRLVCIIAIIGYLSSLVDSAVCFDVYKTVVGYFSYLTRMMMYSGFWNSCKMYCFILLLNFLYWSLDSICAEVVPETAPKSSTSPLNFLIDDVYAGLLKHKPRPQNPWWPPLPERPPWICPRPLMLAIDLLVMSESRVFVASLISLPLLTAGVGDFSVSGFIGIYLFLSE